VANRRDAEYTERKSNEEIILNKPSVISAVVRKNPLFAKMSVASIRFHWGQIRVFDGFWIFSHDL